MASTQKAGSLWLSNQEYTRGRHETARSVLICARLASGELPSQAAERLWRIESVTDCLCNGCGERVMRSQAAYTVQFPKLYSIEPITLHRVCYDTWQRERERFQTAGEPQPPAPASP